MFLRKILYTITEKILKFPNAYRNISHKNTGLLQMGYGSYGQPIIDQYKGSESRVIIGNYTSIAPNVRIIAGGIHPIKTVSQYPFRSRFKLQGMYEDGNPFSKGDIIIGSDVWIGTGVTILSGVTIGNGAVIATNSLVTKDVPDYAIVMGIPSVISDYRFDPTEIKALLQINWWNWDKRKVLENVTLLTDKNIYYFINQFKER